MIRKPINSLPENTPEALIAFAEGAKIYDSSCSPEAKVYYIDKNKGFYLKTAKYPFE